MHRVFKKLIPFFVAIVLILVIGTITFGKIYMEKYSYSTEIADLDEYFQIAGGQKAIVLQDEMIEEKAIVYEENCYFSLEMVHTYFNDTFYADFKENLLLYTTPTEIISVTFGEKEMDVNGAISVLEYVPAVIQDGIVYISADYVKAYTNMSIEVYEKHIQIYNQWGSREMAEVKKDTAIRIKGGIKSPIIRQLVKGEMVEILETMETWSKVKTGDAYVGYVENKLLTNYNTQEEIPVSDYVEPEYTSLTKDEKISIGWHAIGGITGNDTLESVAATAKGMDVIAPTWFSLTDSLGNIQSFGTTNYVSRAHDLGLEVWGVIDDFNYSNTNDVEINVYNVLSSTTTRGNLINNIIEEAQALAIDGINVDFEKVTVDGGEHFAQFIRELSIQCRLKGLVLSVDNYVPFGYNTYYRRDVQGKVADYVIIMGYDEHYHGSGDPGSVASIGYVSDGIDKTLEEVPNNKIINALPLYSILWKTEGANITDEYITLLNTENFLSRISEHVVWDEETAQDYAEWTEGAVTYQYWAENEKSIGVKLNVMTTKNIGGVAVWRLGYETSAIWDLITAYTNSN